MLAPVFMFTQVLLPLCKCRPLSSFAAIDSITLRMPFQVLLLHYDGRRTSVKQLHHNAKFGGASAKALPNVANESVADSAIRAS